MIVRDVSIGEMVNQSKLVITKPSVETFEQFERRGTVKHAAIYVGIVAVISGVLGLLGGGGVGGLIGGLLQTLVGFFGFTGAAYFVAKQLGGSGSYDEVAYTFSLFWVPLSIITSLLILVLTITIVGLLLVPLVALASLVAMGYFSYTAVKSSMNIYDNGRILAILGAAILVSFLINAVVGAIFVRG